MNRDQKITAIRNFIRVTELLFVVTLLHQIRLNTGMDNTNNGHRKPAELSLLHNATRNQTSVH